MKFVFKIMQLFDTVFHSYLAVTVKLNKKFNPVAPLFTIPPAFNWSKPRPLAQTPSLQRLQCQVPDPPQSVSANPPVGLISTVFSSILCLL